MITSGTVGNYGDVENDRQVAAAAASPTPLPSLDDWAEAREQFDDLKTNEVFGDQFDEPGPVPGYVYDGGWIVGPRDGKYWLLIERSEWTSASLERLEGILYELWVKGEWA